MIYLISQLSFWLLLTVAFGALAGWAFAAERAAPAECALQRDRDNLLRDLAKLASGDAPAAPADHEADALASRSLVRESRIAALEQQLETTRARADDAAAEIAELKRRLETRAEEPQHLQAAADNADVVDAVVEPAVDEEAVALQTWRLRYFEQRVRYLETQAKAAPEAAEPVSRELSGDALSLEWRAREAEARAEHLAQELRATQQPVAGATEVLSAEEAAPFAANADVDKLLRWRLLYLERRVAHLQTNVVALEEQQRLQELTDAGPDPDRWKWRARYLEARVRHLEERPAPSPARAVAMRAADEPEPPPPPAPAPRGAKPAVLASARNGAPDDLTLIEGVSLLQQTTLYAFGVFHYDQIAAWTPENVAWVDHYLRLRGRIGEEEWVEQADDLARDGPAAARRVVETEET